MRIILIIFMLSSICLPDAVPGYTPPHKKEAFKAGLQIISGFVIGGCVIADAAKNKKDADKIQKDLNDTYPEGEVPPIDVKPWRLLHTAGVITSGTFVINGMLTIPFKSITREDPLQTLSPQEKKKGIITSVVAATCLTTIFIIFFQSAK